VSIGSAATWGLDWLIQRRPLDATLERTQHARAGAGSCGLGQELRRDRPSREPGLDRPEVELPAPWSRSSFGHAWFAEIVLDPFLGSGTTAAVANRLGRRAVGVEVNPDFLDLIEKKVGAADLGDGGFVVEHEPAPDAGALVARMATWRYRFTDYSTGLHRRTVTPTKGQLAFKAAPRFRVSGVSDATTIETSKGIRIRLAGIVSVAGREADAIAFLSDYIGQRVVLLDGEEDSEGLRSGLVLLENHTFVNGHLLRTGGVAIDATTLDRLRRRLEAHAAKKAA
jgi:modification methylase